MGLWGRAVASGYDWMAGRLDRRGGADHRARLVGEASGEVIEVGAGTGKNLRHYRHADRVVAVEPNPDWRARAEHRLSSASVAVELIDGDGMALPFGDECFDTVVAGLVLCTIPDPVRALAEMRRVLRPTGSLRFYEHIRADDPGQAAWQDRLNRPWGWVAGGCRINQDTVSMIAGAGFRIETLERFDFEAAPRLSRPHAIGVAVPAT